MLSISTVSIFLASLYSNVYTSQAQECSEIQVVGIGNPEHYLLSGVYRLSSNDVCDEKNVYKQVGGSGYLYNKFGNWVIGDRLCVDSGSLKAPDGATYPWLITARWQQSTDAGWQTADDMRIVCYNGFAGCTTVTISGIQNPSQYELTGLYANSTKYTCTGRSVYTQLGGSFYMYYKFGHWVLAYEPCVSQVTFKVQDIALYPEDIQSVWERSVPPVWQLEQMMNVSCYAGFQGCKQVELRGVEEEKYSVLNNVYRLHGVHMCTGRHVYEVYTDSYMLYIYYKNGNWIVGSQLCEGTGTLKVVDAALYVENVTSLWEVSEDTGWAFSDTISVKCFDGFAGCRLILMIGDRQTDNAISTFGLYQYITNITCRNTPVYQQLGGRHYIYHKDAMWMISSNYCSDDSILRAVSNVSYPEDIDSVWEEFVNKIWIQKDSIASNCHRKYTGCNSVKLTGTRHNNYIIGVYNMSPDYCNGRVVYQSVGGANRLYYIPGYWVVGNETCTENYRLKISSISMYPEEADGSPEEKSGTQWVQNSDISVTCYTRFEGCDELRLHNTLSTERAEGIYVVDSESFCDGRHVYVHQSGELYLFSRLGYWIIASASCSNTGWIMRVFSAALYPGQITEKWQEMRLVSGAPVWHSSVAKLLCSGRHSMRLTGTAFRHDAVGVYDPVINETCNQRFVYKQAQGNLYLYYLDGRGLSSSGWFIGPEICKNVAILLVVSTAQYPENITGTWRELKQSDEWYINSEIKLEIDTGFQGCPELTVSYNNDIVDIFSQSADMPRCNGRYSYVDRTGRRLYTASEYWIIGSVLCSEESGIIARVHDGAMYPEEITHNWQMAFDPSTTIEVGCREGCYEVQLTADSAETHDIYGNLTGRYGMMSENSTCFGRRSYRHQSGPMYFFYVGFPGDEFRGWMIGPAMCLDHGLLRVWDPASYPQDIIHVWTRYNGSAWIPDPQVRMSCLQEIEHVQTTSVQDESITAVTPAPSVGEIQMTRSTMILITCVVVVGAVLIVLIISVLIYCLRQQKQQERIPKEIDGHRNPLYSVTEENDTDIKPYAVRMSDLDQEVTSVNGVGLNSVKEGVDLA